MKNGFWGKLERPFFCLAPMAGVTDPAFRSMIAKYSQISERNDVVMWTEFISADGLFMGGFNALKIDLEYSKAERPIIAQFFSKEPELMTRAAELAREKEFDGIDINMGCPDKNVVRQGSGAALIKDPALAREIIRATKAGAGDLPVSVKTRIGFNKIETEVWLSELLAEEPAVVTLHARTKKEMSKVPAHWDEIKHAVEIRDRLGSKTLIVGNGDVEGVADARARAEETEADGVMMGRAVFGNPWLFREDIKWDEIPWREKLRVAVEHTLLFEELIGEDKSFALMKKHFKAYVNGFDDAKDLRLRMMAAENADEVRNIAEEFLSVTKAK